MNIVLRVVALTAIYLLVLTSVHPGDVLIGVVLAVVLVAAGRRIQPLGPPSRSHGARLAGSARAPRGTLVDLIRSTWTHRPVVSEPTAHSPPGLVTIPIPPCPPTSAAAWGARVGITPDTVVVELDEERGRMLFHVIDARDPGGRPRRAARLLPAPPAPGVPATGHAYFDHRRPRHDLGHAAASWPAILALVRARDVHQRLIALDLLAIVVVTLLALLSYYRDVGYYLDAAVALSLLSFVATIAVARYLDSGRPVRMISIVLDVVGAALLLLGLVLITIGLYGVLRLPDTYSQLHAQGLATGPGVIAVLASSGRHGERGDHHLRRARDRLHRVDLARFGSRHRALRPSSRRPSTMTATGGSVVMKRPRRPPHRWPVRAAGLLSGRCPAGGRTGRAGWRAPADRHRTSPAGFRRTARRRRSPSAGAACGHGPSR